MTWLALDVDYRKDAAQKEFASVAAVAFDEWTAERPVFESVHRVPEVHPYEPGAFYKRELPSLLTAIHAALARGVSLDGIVVDGYVWLGPSHAGLGAKLHEYLQTISLGGVAIVGVAKKHFAGADSVACAIERGSSKNALWISSEGIELSDAARKVKQMHGEFRIPTLLRRVDQLCRA